MCGDNSPVIMFIKCLPTGMGDHVLTHIAIFNSVCELSIAVRAAAA